MDGVQTKNKQHKGLGEFTQGAFSYFTSPLNNSFCYSGLISATFLVVVCFHYTI